MYANFLEHKTQIILKESKVRSCTPEQEYRYRAIESNNNQTIDLCGGPHYFNCTDQLSRKIKIDKLHELDEYNVGSLFKNTDKIEKLNKDINNARKMRPHETRIPNQNITIELDPGSEDVNNSDEEMGWGASIWSFFGGIVSFGGIFNYVLDTIKGWVLSIPVVGYIVEFLIDFSEAEKTRVIFLIIATVETIYGCIKSGKFNLVQIGLIGVYFLCPTLFLYVKVISKNEMQIVSDGWRDASVAAYLANKNQGNNCKKDEHSESM